MEALSHRAVEDRVGDPGDRHALMMRHEGADESEALAFRNPRGGEVHRLIESKPAPGAQCRQTFEVCGRGRGINHCGQPGRIRRDDAIFAEAPFQSEARHAKIGILIGQFQIARIVGGLGNPPRQPEFFAVFDLTAHDEPICLLQQTPRGRAHDERRHEVLEHGTRPGDQGRAVGNRRSGATEPEPVTGRNVSLGDREEAGQSRLRRQKVIAIGIQSGFGNEKSDREQLTRAVEEKAELHRHRHRAEGGLQDEQPSLSGGDRLRRRLAIRAMRLDCGQTRPRPVQKVRSASVAALESNRFGDVDHDCGLAREFRQLGRERLLRSGSAVKRLGQGRERILELARRHRLGSATETQVHSMLGGQG